MGRTDQECGLPDYTKSALSIHLKGDVYGTAIM